MGWGVKRTRAKIRCGTDGGVSLMKTTHQNVRSAVELGSSLLLQGSSSDTEVLEAGDTRGRENGVSPIPRSALSVGSKNSSVSSEL